LSGGVVVWAGYADRAGRPPGRGMPASAYSCGHDRLKLSVPFTIDIDLAEIDNL